MNCRSSVLLTDSDSLDAVAAVEAALVSLPFLPRYALDGVRGTDLE